MNERTAGLLMVRSAHRPSTRSAKVGERWVVGRKLRRRLLVCGIAASALLAGTDVLAGVSYRGYDFMAQSISELSAVGAPTRLVVVPLNLAYDALMVAFGVGVWATAVNRAGRSMAVMVIGNAVVSAAWVFFPMRSGEPASSVNVGFGAVSMVFFLLAIGCGAVAYRGLFRLYSSATLLAYLGLTVWGVSRGDAATTGSSASVGVQERTMVAGYLLWVTVLAVLLLRAEKRRSLTAG